jgi:integrase
VLQFVEFCFLGGKKMRTFFREGSWYYIHNIDNHPVTGKRRQIKKGGFKSEKEAMKAGIKSQVEYRSGISAGTERITFGEMAKMWITEYDQRGHVKKSTVFVREKELKIWLNFFDNIQIKKLNMTLIQNALNELRDKYSDNTLSGAFATLKMVIAKARELGYIGTDPSEFAYIPKKRKTLEQLDKEPVTERYLEKDLLKLFLETAEKYGIEHDFVMFRLLAYTGIRIGEALALRWSDIDFESRSIGINRRITHKTNNLAKFELDTPKTISSKRTIPIDTKMSSVLKELQIYQNWFFEKNKKTTDFDFVFINYCNDKYVGYPVTQKHVRTRLKRILRIAGIKQSVTPHTFRHTHTSLMAEAGVDLTTIMERLGHKDDSITKEIYLHITQSLKKEAVHKFERLMNDF